MPSALKGRLEKLVDPLTAIAYDRQARWLEELPADEVAAGIFELVFRSDRELLMERDPGFVGKTDDEIAELFVLNAPGFIEHLRQRARELRGKRP
jgi:hypothetical protein